MKPTYIALLVGLSGLSIACAPATPEIRLLGTANGTYRAQSSEGRVVRAFVEVVNPGDSALDLSRMRYTLHTSNARASVGDIALRRSLPGHSSTVIEVPMVLTRTRGPDIVQRPALHGLDYVLSAQLYARGNRLAHSWQVRTSGRLDDRRAASELRTRPTPLRVANSL